MTYILNNIKYTDYLTGCRTGDTESKDGNAVDGSLKDQNLVIPAAVNGKSVIKIGQRSFIALKSISLPDSLLEIAYGAFDTCSLDINEIILPKSLKVIGVNAFSNNNIKHFTVCENVESIGYGAFSHDFSLESINVVNNNEHFTSVNGVLFNKNMTILYCLPYLVKGFKIPFTVTTLMARSICQNHARTIWIPPSVTSIEKETFFAIPNTKTIHILGNIESLDSGCIHDGWSNNIESIFYHGSNPFNETNSFSNKPNIKVYVCEEYGREFFAQRKVIRKGSCYVIPRTCKRKSSSNRFLITFILLQSKT
jgi:hypothetical protein